MTLIDAQYQDDKTGTVWTRHKEKVDTCAT